MAHTSTYQCSYMKRMNKPAIERNVIHITGTVEDEGDTLVVEGHPKLRWGIYQTYVSKRAPASTLFNTNRPLITVKWRLGEDENEIFNAYDDLNIRQFVSGPEGADLVISLSQDTPVAYTFLADLIDEHNTYDNGWDTY